MGDMQLIELHPWSVCYYLNELDYTISKGDKLVHVFFLLEKRADTAYSPHTFCPNAHRQIWQCEARRGFPCDSYSFSCGYRESRVDA